MTANETSTTVRSPVFLQVQLQVLLKAESSLGHAHFYFQDVGTGERSEVLEEGMVESSWVHTYFSLGMEEVVGHGSPLVENNLEDLHTCFLEVVGGKGEPFS